MSVLACKNIAKIMIILKNIHFNIIIFQETQLNMQLISCLELT